MAITLLKAARPTRRLLVDEAYDADSRRSGWHTVEKWRHRFVQNGIEGLTGEYRAGRPRTVSDVQVAMVIEPMLKTTRKNDATHDPLHGSCGWALANHHPLDLGGQGGLQLPL